jgi:hypothetical protein
MGSPNFSKDITINTSNDIGFGFGVFNTTFKSMEKVASQTGMTNINELLRKSREESCGSPALQNPKREPLFKKLLPRTGSVNSFRGKNNESVENIRMSGSNGGSKTPSQ